MENIVEATYPINFREEDTKRLGVLLKNRRSAVLTGMTRVGISNFLRFFLNHPKIKETYIKEEHHIFIPIDLNDLTEREIFPFWVLTFKRIVDNVSTGNFPTHIKKQVESLFLDSIQSGDHFLTIDGIQKSLVILVKQGYLPTLFFIRFDRMANSATSDFFANFQGLIEATHKKLSFVFTSLRPLDMLKPEIFTKHALSIFADNLYIKPAQRKDVDIIFNAAVGKYDFTLSTKLKEELLSLVDGYNQYLQFALISLSEQITLPINSAQLLSILLMDERLTLQSEELWESLNTTEKEMLMEVVARGKINVHGSEYLENTGMISLVGKYYQLFSPLFEFYLLEKQEEKQKENQKMELSKKEHLLMQFLEENKDEICERELIIERVWPEAESLGVSDWAVDRLVARVRQKLKTQNYPNEIVTIKTRGYKLVTKA